MDAPSDGLHAFVADMTIFVCARFGELEKKSEIEQYKACNNLKVKIG